MQALFFIAKKLNKFILFFTHLFVPLQNGIELYLGRFFPACLCDSIGEADILRGLGSVPRHDGLYILVVKDRI